MADPVSSRFKEHISDSASDIVDELHLKEELDEAEERQGLLSGRTDTPTRESGGFPREPPGKGSWSWKRMAIIISTMTVLLVAAYSGAMYYMRLKSLERIREKHFDGQMLRSNGTHEFKRTVLIVSIDGLRYVTYSFLISDSQLRRSSVRYSVGPTTLKEG